MLTEFGFFSKGKITGQRVFFKEKITGQRVFLMEKITGQRVFLKEKITGQKFCSLPYGSKRPLGDVQEDRQCVPAIRTLRTSVSM